VSGLPRMPWWIAPSSPSPLPEGEGGREGCRFARSRLNVRRFSTPLSLWERGWERGATFAIALLFSTLAHAEAPDAGMPDAGLSEAADAGAPVAEKEKDPLADLPAATPLSLKVALEKAEVGLAEPFGLVIEVRHLPTETYELPRVFEWKAFHIRDRKSEARGEDPITTIYRLSLQAFEVGDVELPAFRMLVTTPEGARQLEVPAQKLKVVGVIDAAQGEPHLREDSRALPTKYRTVYWPMVLIAALLAAVAGFVWWRRRADRPPPAPPPKPRAPAYEEALARLAALERAELVAKGEKQAFHFRLSEVVRDYVGRRFTFEALELTSDELLGELRRRSTPGLDFDGLAGFLRSSDLVKFARVDPTDGECKTALDTARLLIERTKPLPPVEDRDGA
jgi:hypothetical protein